jgi:hypothetical protein
MVLRGSWNRTPASGSKVVFLEFDNDEDTVANAVHDFCTGFLTDSVKKERWARPVGLEIAADGAVYITSDDLKNFIIKLTPPVASRVGNDDAWRSDASIAPQPASSTIVLRWPSATADVDVRVVTLQGETVLQRAVSHASILDGASIDTSTLPSATYVVQIAQLDRTLHLPLVVRR